MVIETNATNFAAGNFSVIDAAHTGAAFQPSRTSTGQRQHRDSPRLGMIAFLQLIGLWAGVR